MNNSSDSKLEFSIKNLSKNQDITDVANQEAISNILIIVLSDGRIRTEVSSETRVWRRDSGAQWMCCHLHRSNALHNSTS